VRPHVLFVSGSCCTRVHKEAQALRDRGWRVESLSWAQPSMPRAFTSWEVASRRNLAAHIAASSADLIHVHNGPDQLMRHAARGARGRPIVYDCHDLGFHRTGTMSRHEAFAFARADGIVNVSEEYRDVAFRLHPWTCPEAVVMSCPPRRWAPRAGSPRSGVVYEGGLVRPGHRMNWRDLSPVTTAFACAGVPLDLYVNPGMARFYPRVQRYLPYRRLLQRLTRYEYGWIGTDAPVDKGQAAVPNKLWDYAIAGVVPVVCNRPAAAAVFGAGAIVASSAADALEQIATADADALRALIRPRYMDEEIDGLVRLYEALLEEHSACEG